MKTLEEAEQLLKDFNNQRLDKKDWTHEAHLTVALLHLKQYDLYDTICRMRSGIILLNKAHGTENTGQKGYHETLTIFTGNGQKIILHTRFTGSRKVHTGYKVQIHQDCL